jgi:hypothetical protein
MSVADFRCFTIKLHKFGSVRFDRVARIETLTVLIGDLNSI